MLSGRSGAHGATAPEGLAQRDGTPARVRSCGGHTERRLAGRAEQTRNAKTSRSGSILAATQWRRTRRHWGCRTDLDKGESTSGPAMPAIYRLGTYPDEAIRVLTPLSPPMRHTPRNLPRGALCGCFRTASGEGGPNGPLSVWSLRYGRPLRLRPVSGRATYARGLAVQHLVSQIAVVSRWIASSHSLTTLVRRRTAQLPPADHSGSSRRIGRLFPRVRSSARTVEVAARLIGQCGRLQ